MTTSDAHRAYKASRDQLLALRGQQVSAIEEFRWPDLGEQFNWAVDWFDAIARGNDRPALVIVEEDGSQHRAHLRRDGPPLGPGRRRGSPRRCGQGATRAGDARQPGRALGGDAGDHEARSGDHADEYRRRARRPGRPDRPRRAATSSELRRPAKFDDVPGVSPTCATGELRPLHCRCSSTDGPIVHDAYDLPPEPAAHPGTAPGDTLLLYFTSGTTSTAEAGRAHPGLLPGRAPRARCTGSGCGRATCT